MIHLLNTLFVTSEDIYLSLDGEKCGRQPGASGGRPLPAPYLERHYLPSPTPVPLPP